MWEMNKPPRAYRGAPMTEGLGALCTQEVLNSTRRATAAREPTPAVAVLVDVHHLPLLAQPLEADRAQARQEAINVGRPRPRCSQGTGQLRDRVERRPELGARGGRRGRRLGGVRGVVGVAAAREQQEDADAEQGGGHALN